MSKKVFACILIVVYFLLFGEVYIRVLGFMNVTAIKTVETMDAALDKANLKVDRLADWNVLLVGDSTLLGLGISNEDLFSRVLEQDLNNRLPRATVQIVDAMTAGSNIYRKWQMFHQYVRNNPAPEILILFYKFEDIYGELPSLKSEVDIEKISGQALKTDLSLKQRQTHMGESLLQKSQFINFVLPRINILLKRNGIIMPFTKRYDLQKRAYKSDSESWRRAQEYFLDIKKTCDARGIRLIVFLIPDLTVLPQNLMRENISTLVIFCRQNGIDVLDGFNIFKGFSSEEVSISAIDGHPNGRAHRIMAKEVADRVALTIARASGAGNRAT
jgi:hypothetical protein